MRYYLVDEERVLDKFNEGRFDYNGHTDKHEGVVRKLSERIPSELDTYQKHNCYSQDDLRNESGMVGPMT